MRETRARPDELRNADALILSNSVRGPFRVGRLLLADGEALDLPAWPEKLQTLAQRWENGDE